MRGRLGKQVNPKITAVAILALLVAIQYVWWKGLVERPKVAQGQSSGPMTMMGGPAPIAGRGDVVVETLAGIPEPGDTDGAGHSARFDGPTGIALDPKGILYVADTRNHRIRRISPYGYTETAAGTARGMRDGPEAQALFNGPCALRWAPDGALLVADEGNRMERRLADGVVTSRPAPPRAASGVPGVRYLGVPVIDWLNGTPDGAIRLKRIVVSIPAPGGTFAADANHSAVFHVQDGVAHVLAGSAMPDRRMSGWRDGTGENSLFGRIGGMAFDGQRTLYVADTTGNVIRRVTLPPDPAAAPPVARTVREPDWYAPAGDERRLRESRERGGPPGGDQRPRFGPGGTQGGPGGPGRGGPGGPPGGPGGAPPPQNEEVRP